MRPYLDSDFLRLTGQPDLGRYTTDRQQPVDSAVWQAADGIWQLWSCIRGTGCGGQTRLFHAWEGASLDAPDWAPRGIAMEADPALGETPGGLQAPHVIRHDGRYLMFYGDWERICLATSEDGKTFTRTVQGGGQPALFSGPFENTRDPMVMVLDGTFYCYYRGHRQGDRHQAAVFCRTSTDLSTWSDPVTVCAGGAAVQDTNWYGGDCECPFVLPVDGGFCLFRNQRYGADALNTQYVSPDPLSFGVDDDRYRVGTLPVAAPEIVTAGDQTFLVCLTPGLDGMQAARLGWQD